MGNTDIERMIMLDYRLTTAEIFYRFPDHPSLLQCYVWQDLDATPDFPELKKFLGFWERSLDGKVHSIKICSCVDIRGSGYSTRTIL
ncbi:MAG: Usg family protein [Alphaproteobacteria bacterium]|nr:MAG: Usg family protein [Alphaproteobacteria bacterium]